NTTPTPDQRKHTRTLGKTTASKIDERQVLAALIDNEPHLTGDRPGLLILADKGYIAAELDRFPAARGISQARPGTP
ncbi:hypothetical protein P9869_43990, partial [Streptomyces ossamyceticus]|nr:hypothetical protein [Streptomyces ossamyceticus]